MTGLMLNAQPVVESGRSGTNGSSNEVEVIFITIRNLKAEVEAVIRPYESSNAVPPFSVAELMVMAWVCRPTQSCRFVSDKEIHDWMSLKFGWYRKMALAQLYEHAFQRSSPPLWKEMTPFQHFSHQRALQMERLDVPLEYLKFDKDAGRMKSNRASSRRFLRRVLQNEMPQFSRFLELPAEIRMMIYEETFRSGALVLQYTDVEFQSQSPTYKMRLSAQFQRPDQSFAHNWTLRMNLYPGDRLRVTKWATEPTSKLMALLCVNRQIFKEAMPVFYSTHKFYVDNLHELGDMLLHCGPRRREHFTNISMSYSSRYSDSIGPKTTSRAFKLLKEVKSLRSLEIAVEDQAFLKGGRSRSARHESVAKIPGMRMLSELRVRKLDFTCNCPMIESYLRPKMLKDIGGDEVDEPHGKRKPARKSRKVPKKGKGAANDDSESSK